MTRSYMNLNSDVVGIKWMINDAFNLSHITNLLPYFLQKKTRRREKKMKSQTFSSTSSGNLALL